MAFPSVFGRCVIRQLSFVPRALTLRAVDILDGVENGVLNMLYIFVG